MPNPELPIIAELISRGDGTFILRPTKVPTDQFGQWISVKQAAQFLDGNPKPSSLYSLLGEFLVYRKPLRSKVEVSLKSVIELRAACNDPDFWDNPISQAAIRKSVKAAMDSLLESSLQKP